MTKKNGFEPGSEFHAVLSVSKILVFSGSGYSPYFERSVSVNFGIELVHDSFDFVGLIDSLFLGRS
jgi:hypothetical protein